MESHNGHQQSLSDLQLLRAREVAQLVAAKPYSEQANSIRSNIEYIDGQIAKMQPTGAQNSGNLPYPSRLPTTKPNELVAHANFLTAMRNDWSEQLKKVEPGSRRARRLAARIEALDPEIAQLRPYVEEPRILKSLNEVHRKEQLAQAPNDIRKGLGCFVFGVVATVGGYATAGPGDHYYVFWGAIVFGAFILIRAIGTYREWW